ncbi:hypothetical protein J4429_03580 [Candidatus Pacearchaeota archaeon]|nr:hypothetical protein [Candidatus Pacearchaeota archaeon]
MSNAALEQTSRRMSPELRAFGALAERVLGWISEMRLSYKFPDMVQDYYIEARRLINNFELQIEGRDSSRIYSNRLIGYCILIDNLRDQVKQGYEEVTGAQK